MPMGMRFDVLADGRVFSTNDLISATSLSKCATALGRFSKEISFVSIMIVFNDYGANEISDFAVIQVTTENTEKNTEGGGFW